MNLPSMKNVFLFHTFRHIFPFHFDPLFDEQCDQNGKKKSAQKLKQSNKPFNVR